MNLSPKVRDTIYIALAITNAALLAASEQNAIPAAYGHYFAIASLLVASMMTKFMAPAPPAPPAPPGAP